MRMSDWSSDVCSSDLVVAHGSGRGNRRGVHQRIEQRLVACECIPAGVAMRGLAGAEMLECQRVLAEILVLLGQRKVQVEPRFGVAAGRGPQGPQGFDVVRGSRLAAPDRKSVV